MNIFGGALKEFVYSYSLFIHNVQVTSVETSQRGRLYEISGNPRRVVWFCRRERGCMKVVCVMGSSRLIL
jgi:hypothetical protein